MTNDPFNQKSDAHNVQDKYYIMYDPTTVNLMGKIGDNNFTMVDIVEYLTGNKLETCNERNYTDFLSFNTNLLRKGMLEQMAIEPYSLYYIANQICRADQNARVMLADDNRRTIGQIISQGRKKTGGCFYFSYQFNFPVRLCSDSCSKQG